MRKMILVLSLLFIMAGMVPAVYGGFYDLGVGARPLGMGHAFVAVANDVNAVYYNPAGLINIMATEFTFMYAPLFMGLTDGSGLMDLYGAFAMKISRETAVGGAWTARYLTGPGFNEDESLYQENTFYGSYATWLLGNLAVGANIKIPMHTYGQDQYTKNGLNDSGNTTGTADQVFANGYSKLGFSADVGLMYMLNDAFTLGLCIQNIFSTNLALSSDPNAYDPAPLYMRAGVGFKIPTLGAVEDLTIASDAVYHIGSMKNDIKLHSGLEAWFFYHMLAARFGFGAGTNGYLDLSIGGTYAILGPPDVQIDYSWNCPLSGVSVSGNHRISCTFRL